MSCVLTADERRSTVIKAAWMNHEPSSHVNNRLKCKSGNGPDKTTAENISIYLEHIDKFLYIIWFSPSLVSVSKLSLRFQCLWPCGGWSRLTVKGSDDPPWPWSRWTLVFSTMTNTPDTLSFPPLFCNIILTLNAFKKLDFNNVIAILDSPL